MANQWRYIGSVNVTTGVAGHLDAIYTLGTKTTYYDGSTRTPGSGVAATYTQVQASGTTVAVHATPATTSQGLKYIWAGAASGSGTAATPDYWNANDLQASINLDSGAYAGWDQALPFTSGRFFGYWKAGVNSACAGTPTLHMYECALAVFYVFAYGTNVKGGCLGKFLVAPSSAAADSEADGNIYGVTTSGGGIAGSQIWGLVTQQLSPTGNNAKGPFFHRTNPGQSHTAVFRPGTSNLKTCHLNQTMPSGAANATMTAPSGALVAIDRYIPLMASNSPFNLLGVLDGFMMFQAAQMGQVVADTVNNKDIGYVVGENPAADDCAYLLLRNET